jgi:hypothetical protein
LVGLKPVMQHTARSAIYWLEVGFLCLEKGHGKRGVEGILWRAVIGQGELLQVLRQ